jgi:hypothetical protein
MKDEALKLALEALEEHHYGVAQIIIREALAQPEQEPMAYVEYETGNQTKRPQNCGTGYCSCIECVMEPPQRTWVGLDAEDRLCAKYMQDAPDGIEAVIDYIEAKLKELNHG